MPSIHHGSRGVPNSTPMACTRLHPVGRRALTRKAGRPRPPPRRAAPRARRGWAAAPARAPAGRGHQEAHGHLGCRQRGVLALAAAVKAAAWSSPTPCTFPAGRSPPARGRRPAAPLDRPPPRACTAQSAPAHSPTWLRQTGQAGVCQTGRSHTPVCLFMTRRRRKRKHIARVVGQASKWSSVLGSGPGGGAPGTGVQLKPH